MREEYTKVMNSIQQNIADQFILVIIDETNRLNADLSEKIFGI